MPLYSQYSKESAPADDVYDVCICGSGPAGITLARSLAKQGWRVALMEGGGQDYDERSQSRYIGDELGLPYPIVASRLRYFGGTSNHWGGDTRPLDACDFEPLSYHPLNEWPIKKRDLDIYAAETANILDLGEPSSGKDILAGANTGLHLLSPAYRPSPPTRFGRKYAEEIKRSDNLHLFLNANLVDIELDQSHTSVARLLFRSDSQSEPFFIKARHYTLCCGGLENARALLLANKQLPEGVGNQHGLVGRFFCEHIEVPVGNALMRSTIYGESSYRASDAFRSEKKCLNFIAGIYTPPGERSDGSFFERLKRAVWGTSAVAGQMSSVSVSIQQECIPDNRVTLSDERDDLGLRRLALNWRVSELDRHTLRVAALEVASTLAKSDLGRMQIAPYILNKGMDYPKDYVKGMSHHMCTTRMSNSPREGVVDSNCKVHGIENLYLGGSSVFASAGVSNPTYTIVQLALRLGEHIHTRLVS